MGLRVSKSIASLGKPIQCLMLFLLLLSSVLCTCAMEEETGVYIVYLKRREALTSEALEESHLRLLASVLGSMDSARAALLYSYTTAINGFSAKLTPSQANELKEKPGVLEVVPSQTYHVQDEGLRMMSNMV
ncbi:hypothetical protein KP509_28G060600 [Ceratopteris richardii]|uniref:Inhibitor I9 domain-containing protein n=2 Tax=Ceratopteris richardii TaxID=49495 RepID=A0A8T2RFB3_CERRI|nr:hypothetical protein KP509_28G060600 [Ceratopteris richardii]KAH7294202.1 hypothetical protein KP509_28G060600 [Ceratopteris richardii]KAH7294203.1 hypothetical protein KP509_28G060600 [Ceratopteris richardii]